MKKTATKPRIKVIPPIRVNEEEETNIQRLARKHKKPVATWVRTRAQTER